MKAAFWPMRKTRREATSFPGFSPTRPYWAREIGTVRREPWRRGWGRSKKSACYQSIVLAFPTFTAWTSRSSWLTDDTRCSGEIPACLSGTKWPSRSSCSFDDAVGKRSSLISKIVLEIKEKQKNCKIYCLRGKMLLDIFHLGLKKAWFTNLFEIRRWQAKTTHKLVIMWNVALEFVWSTGFPSFLSRRCVWT